LKQSNINRMTSLLSQFNSLQRRFSSYFEYIFFVGFENKSMHSTHLTPLMLEFDPTACPWFSAACNHQGFVVAGPYPNRLCGNMVAA